MIVGGHKYATLANTIPDPGTSGSPNCQNYYISLPVGWIVAPNNCHSWFALGCNSWQTDAVVFADGYSYRSKPPSWNYWSAPWAYYGSGILLTNSNGQYSVNTCKYEILITDDINAVYAPCPSNPSSCVLCGPGTYSSNVFGVEPCKIAVICTVSYNHTNSIFHTYFTRISICVVSL